MRTSIFLSALLWTAPAATAVANVITDWDEKAVAIVQTKMPPPSSYRIMATMHLAMFEAVNAIEPRYQPYKGKLAASATQRVATWQPIDNTPLHPEYPCAHCIVSSSLAAVIRAVLGSDEIPEVSMTSPFAPGVTHRFSNLAAYTEEVANARIYAGFHYRFSTADGATLGADVGHYVTGTLMQPPSQRQLIARSPRSPAGCHQARRWYLPWPVHGGVG